MRRHDKKKTQVTKKKRDEKVADQHLNYYSFLLLVCYRWKRRIFSSISSALSVNLYTLLRCSFSTATHFFVHSVHSKTWCLLGVNEKSAGRSVVRFFSSFLISVILCIVFKSFFFSFAYIRRKNVLKYTRDTTYTEVKRKKK